MFVARTGAEALAHQIDIILRHGMIAIRCAGFRRRRCLKPRRARTFFHDMAGSFMIYNQNQEDEGE